MPALDLSKLQAMVENTTSLTEAARAESERDRDYYDGHQWSEDEIKTLKKRRQPIRVDNLIRRRVDAMVGMEQRGRTDPRALPRNPNDEKASVAATKALTFVDDRTRFDVKRSRAFENMLVEGIGACEIGVKRERGRAEIDVRQIRWEELIYDSHSREKDFSDASFMGVMKWMTIDAALALYGEDHREMLESSLTSGEAGQSYEDRPFQSGAFRWVDERQRRIRIASLYYLSQGDWYLAIFTSAGEIYNAASPYVDEDGAPTCPIMAMTAYVDRENRRYGLVRDFITLQDGVNSRNSRLQHLSSHRQTVGLKGAVGSTTALKREMAQADAHIEVDEQALPPDVGNPLDAAFRILPVNDQIAAQFQLLQEDKAAISNIGPNPAALGEATNATSGRAILAQQQAAQAEIAPIYDSLRDWTLRCYRAMFERIKQFWTDERWIRVTDELGQNDWLAVNQTIGFDPITMRPIIDNALARMDVDIVIDDVPEHATLQGEQFEQLSNMAQAGIPIPPEILIEASSLRNKAEILTKMRGGDDPAAAQAAIEQQQLMMREKAAKTAKDEASANKSNADAQKTQIEAQRLLLGL